MNFGRLLESRQSIHLKWFLNCRVATVLNVFCNVCLYQKVSISFEPKKWKKKNFVISLRKHLFWCFFLNLHSSIDELSAEKYRTKMRGAKRWKERPTSTLIIIIIITGTSVSTLKNTTTINWTLKCSIGKRNQTINVNVTHKPNHHWTTISSFLYSHTHTQAIVMQCAIELSYQW